MILFAESLKIGGMIYLSAMGVVLVLVTWGTIYSATKRTGQPFVVALSAIGALLGIVLAGGVMFLLPISVGAIPGMIIGALAAVFGALIGKEVAEGWGD